MSKTAFEKAKDFIEKAGFSHIKIEMEADLGREDSDYECDECYGDGHVDCAECQGEGVVYAERPNGSEVEVECDECYGDGRLECSDCEGEGRRYGGDAWDVDECDEWIRNHVSDKAREALTYSKFYYDGSVDSEMTLTLPVKNAEYMVEYLEAFKALSEEIGNGLDTGGAGLHICVIPKETNGHYPAPRNTLPADKFNNFASEVTKLLPALYMLASADGVSRDLGYRRPQISAEEKYSAINGSMRSSLEFRIFETCYEKPEMVLEYVEVIAKTLRFYHNPSLKVKELGMEFALSDGEHRTSRFYQSPDAIKILRKQLAYLKPSGKTIAELMAEREVPNVTQLKKNLSSKSKELRKKWHDDKKRIETVKKQPLTEQQKEYKKRLMSNDGYDGGHTEQEADLIVRGIQEQMPLVDYLNSNLYGYRGRYRNSYTLSV